MARLLSSLTPNELLELRHNWAFWARPEQLLPPGDWLVALYLSGRGWGKTRVGAEAVVQYAEQNPNERIALVGATAGDARHVMVTGDAGIMAVSHPKRRPNYLPSQRMIVWPNGTIATLYSAEEPNRLRGPSHSFAWLDELAAWKRMRETWDNLMFGLRLGAQPRAVVTTTGKPRRLLLEISQDPQTVTIRGRTADNAPNLAPSFLRAVTTKYGGTRLGRQELEGELLMDVPGALWNRDLIESTRWLTRRDGAMPQLHRVVVAIDPAVTVHQRSAETGIIVAGVAKLYDGKDHLFVYRDRSGRWTANRWGKIAVEEYHGEMADAVVGEVNNGGDLIKQQVHTYDPNVNFQKVHATRGKRKRAEPVAALWEQKRGHIVDSLPELEDQLASFVPNADDTDDADDEYGDTPVGNQDDDATQPVDETGATVHATFAGGYDRADAMVWAATDLIIDALPERDFSDKAWGLDED